MCCLLLAEILDDMKWHSVNGLHPAQQLQPAPKRTILVISPRLDAYCLCARNIAQNGLPNDDSESYMCCLLLAEILDDAKWHSVNGLHPAQQHQNHFSDFATS